jgi:nucleotide-binding universal stress UspA family protein
MMQRILCPTDLTADSKDSVAYALRLARENRAQLMIFHATSFPSLYRYPGELAPDYRWERLVFEFKMAQILANAERRVRNFIEASFRVEIGDIAWQPKVALGKMSEEIVAAALQDEIDLIVMARRKQGPLARILSGSGPEAVIRSAPCPVLSVDTKQDIHPARAWRLPLVKEIFQSS